MSPEQVRGVAVDKRADIWAFGIVLYEMLTGRQAFAEETISEILAAVLKTDPDWNALPAENTGANAPSSSSLPERDRRRRLRDIGDAVLEIDEAVTAPSPDGELESKSSAWRTAVPWVLASLALIVAAIAVASWLRAPTSTSRPVMRWTASLPHSGSSTAFSFSPDGKASCVRCCFRRVGETLRTRDGSIGSEGAHQRGWH